MEWYCSIGLIFCVLAWVTLAPMLPAADMRQDLAVQWALANTLNPTPANVMALITAPFALTETTVATDLTLASFSGSTPIAVETGVMTVVQDPNTLEWIMILAAGTPPFMWTLGGAPGAPVTIYGYALLSPALDRVFALAQFPTPITLTAPSQFINIEPVEFRFVIQPVS